MTVQEQLNEDYIKAFKAKDPKYKTLNMIRAAVKQVEVDTRKELTDEDVIKIFKSEVKKRKDSIEAYTKGNRQDLVEIEEKEIEIIAPYLPAQLDESIVRETVKKIIAELNATITDMGKVMGKTMAELKDKGDVDGNVVKRIVGEELK